MPEHSAKDVLKALEARFGPGEVVFAEGDATRDMYILLAGEVEIRRRGQPLAVVKEPDTYLGEMSTLLGVPRTATVVAVRETRLVRVPEHKVVDFIAHSPALGLKLARVLARRLQEMNDKYEALARPAEVSGGSEGLKRLLEASPAHRDFLQFYRSHAGASLPVAEVLRKLGLLLAEANPVFVDYARAGLVDIRGNEMAFLAARDPELRRFLGGGSAGS